ncbi:MAG: hypothetical protein M9924_20745 [Rhizobiaceae bacterium]|nr:hypothetical protein [Rhizobiaceae bacterium]
MPRELFAEELAHGSFEGRTIGAGSRRHDQMHDVPALATVQFPAPFLLNEIACLCGIADQSASVLANFPFGPSEQFAHTRRAPFHPIAVPMESEPGFDIPAGIGIIEMLLDDAGSLPVAGQSLALPIAQYNDSGDIQLVRGSLSRGVSEPAITKSRPQDLAQLVILVDVIVQ